MEQGLWGPALKAPNIELSLMAKPQKIFRIWASKAEKNIVFLYRTNNFFLYNIKLNSRIKYPTILKYVSEMIK